ncbi:protein singed wings 2 isoform X1 [Galleria mellonella]|uniref:Protein singed wings 2 isoform X1 n=1 Tax=Galleria mellonella TaxID=7137 RepID=A0ABM3M8A3_GALME|nr:protein singed wings 2 isoform X1 [Galleria mellonella]
MKVIERLLLLSFVTAVTPGPHYRRRNNSDYLVNKLCSVREHIRGHCEPTHFKLTCRKGFADEWLNGIKHEISHLHVIEWPGKCLNVGQIQEHFPNLKSLEIINSTVLHSFKENFKATSKIENLTVHGLTSLWEIPPEIVENMKELRIIDLRGNMLRHIKAGLLRGPKLQRVYLSDNKWDCSDGGLDWLAMERDNNTLRKRIIDYYDLMCHQQLYRGKPLHKVMDIIWKIRHTCPMPCACTMTHVVSDAAGTVIPLITVDCAGRELNLPPANLPPSTTTLRLENNKINTIRSIIQNREYQKLADLYLDNNSISAVKELEGSEWFTTFRVLSLRGNMLKQIPVYAFDKAFQANNNIMHVFLGRNPWRCDCHFIPRFQSLLLKYKRVIRDLADIRCSKSSDKTTSLMQISTMPLGHVCSNNDIEMPISPINIVNLVLFGLILLIMGRFFYDWHNFKTTGKLPWLSSILP